MQMLEISIHEIFQIAMDWYIMVGLKLKQVRWIVKLQPPALLEHTCLTNQTIGWDGSKIITTNWRYHGSVKTFGLWIVTSQLHSLIL